MVGWSDGLGNDVNEKNNSILWCQLSRIQNLVNRLYYEGRIMSHGFIPLQQRVAFWMDTLCVPIGEHNISHRKSAIRHISQSERGSRTRFIDPEDSAII